MTFIANIWKISGKAISGDQADQANRKYAFVCKKQTQKVLKDNSLVKIRHKFVTVNVTKKTIVYITPKYTS